MITGSTVALVTPMTAAGDICWQTLEQLIEFHVFNGTEGIVAAGTTGESATLSFEEHAQVIRFTVEKVAGRVPVIAGAGGNSTAEAIKLTKDAKQYGADAVLSVVPYYNKPTQKGLIAHFTAIADAVDIPILLYNVPGRTIVDMTVETVAVLAKHKNIVGIKDATGDVSRVQPTLEACGPDFAQLSGDDATSCEFLLAGGHGTVSVTANVSPKGMVEMVSAARQEDRDRAERFDQLLVPLHQKLFVEPNPIPVKWALNQMGLIPPGIRLPLTELDACFHEEVMQALKDSGVAG
ncbi:4-hydroxy-tetrahydrodipicolinate synthase [Salinibius halmophilus]|uniref:4-hydroxy-tetrahydrodipicolinate synthase n=1 Tax=Salinibius halmophilus TaxID=1853216 RepID=UPI000E66ED0C|nr:4-hydroxy-tetrahydrodipicolinate synthase [Salinibius halmophilus]